MIEFPEEIIQMITTIEDAGFEVYTVGGCVRDSLLGKRPEDWDLTSNASRNILEALFPQAVVINQKLGVMRIHRGEITADIAAYRIDGEYKDFRRPETVIFTRDINEDLRRRDFTMNAVAVSPFRGVNDPFGGRKDIEDRQIRGIGNPRVRFEEDALRILRGVRFAAQLGFDLEKDTFAAMKEKTGLLRYISTERIREEFQKILTAGESGKGLRLLMETGAMDFVVGEFFLKTALKTELEQLTRLSESIDETGRDLLIRMALFYLCLEKGRGAKAILHLGFSGKIKTLLLQAVDQYDLFCEIRDKAALKKIIVRYGLEFYHFMMNVAGQNARICDSADAAIRIKQELYDEIQRNKEPVFPADLAVKGSDLIALGVKEGRQVGAILACLLDAVQKDPEKNKKEQLLRIAQAQIAEEEND